MNPTIVRTGCSHSLRRARRRAVVGDSSFVRSGLAVGPQATSPASALVFEWATTKGNPDVGDHRAVEQVAGTHAAPCARPRVSRSDCQAAIASGE